LVQEGVCRLVYRMATIILIPIMLKDQHTHTTAEQTTRTNTERETAQRRVRVEVVSAAPKIVVVRFAAERRPLGRCSYLIPIL